jgi:hypothetical protein
MGFANIDTNLFNGINIGEAPMLSQKYGEYDDGENVFARYWNFNGTSLPIGWKIYTNSQPVAMAYYNVNINRPFEMIDQPNGSRWVNGISIGLNQGSIGYAYVLYPSISYWGDDGTIYGLYAYNSSPYLLSSSGPSYFPIQMGVGYNGKIVSSIYGGNLTSLNSTLVNFSSNNTIFVSSETWGIGGSASVSVNNSLILSVSIGTSGQIITETNFVAIAYYPPNGVMPTYTINGYVLTFKETGYPNGKQWSVLINNMILNSTTQEISLILTPKTYSFIIIPGYGRYPNPSNGTIYLTNNNITININFTFLKPIVRIPLTIINRQPFPTGVYEQFLRINDRNYSKYINYNFSNVEFTYQNSTFIPAWIAGPANNSSYTTVVLKLDSIPARSSMEIYMDFLPKNVSILSEYGPTGEGYFSPGKTFLTDNYSWYDDGSDVFPVYTIFDAPTLPNSWLLMGSAQFIPNVGVETVNGAGYEMGAVIFNSNLSGNNITVWANTYYQGTADQQNLGIYASNPSTGTGDNGAVASNGYTMGFNPYYSSNNIYYNGQSIASSSFWSGGTSYFWDIVSINSTSINYTVIQLGYSNVQNIYYLNYTGKIVKSGGLFFSSSTGASDSYQYIFDIIVMDSPPNNYMPNVTFGNHIIPEYNVTFYESGLQPGTTWSVTLNGSTVFSTSNIITFSEPNGSYSYEISEIPGYKSNNYSGTILVEGNPVNLSIHWTMILYKIKIIETGLSNGTEWYFTLVGTTFNDQYINITLNSRNNTITFNEPNGTYEFFVKNVGMHVPIPSTGTLNISGSSILQNIAFIIEYKITFLVIGLPHNVHWYLIFNGNNLSSSLNKTVIFVINGSYQFSVDSTIYINSYARYVANETNGIINLYGANKTIIISYHLQYYVSIYSNPQDGGNVTPASGWYNNSSYLKINALPNYNYELLNWNGTGNGSYSGNNSSFTLYIKGPIIEIANFIEIYRITFVEYGLPTGTNWSVTLNNITKYSTGTNITFIVTNGTYNYIINSPSGYIVQNANGKLSTEMQLNTIKVEFTHFNNNTINPLPVILITIIFLFITALVRLFSKKKN